MVAQKARIFLQIKEEEEEEEDSRDIYLRRLGGGNAFYIIKEREMGVDKKGIEIFVCKAWLKSAGGVSAKNLNFLY